MKYSIFLLFHRITSLKFHPSLKYKLNNFTKLNTAIFDSDQDANVGSAKKFENVEEINKGPSAFIDSNISSHHEDEEQCEELLLFECCRMRECDDHRALCYCRQDVDSSPKYQSSLELSVSQV